MTTKSTHRIEIAKWKDTAFTIRVINAERLPRAPIERIIANGASSAPTRTLAPPSGRPPCRSFRLERWSRFLFCVLFVLVFSDRAASAVTLPPPWRWSNPTPHGANIVDQAVNDSLFVQVGERGQIYLSDDWETWIPRDIYATVALRGAVFFGGRLVITGEAGTVVFADDPWNFHGLTLDTTDWLESVAASSNLLVAVGDNAAIYVSTNAVNWDRVVPSFNNWLRSIACDGSTFVAVGEQGLIAGSQNATNWQVCSSGTKTDLNRVSWLGDHFLTVGNDGVALSSTRRE